MNPCYNSFSIGGCFYYPPPTVEGQEEKQFCQAEGYSADQYYPAQAYPSEMAPVPGYMPHALGYMPHAYAAYPSQAYAPHVESGYRQPYYPSTGFSSEGYHPDQSFGQVDANAFVSDGRQKPKKELKKLKASFIGGKVGRAFPNSVASAVTAKTAEEVNKVYEETHKSIEDDRNPSADGVEDSAIEEVAVPQKKKAQAAENDKDSDLRSFGERVKESKGVAYLIRQDYRDKITHSIGNPMEFCAWEDATFHNPPRKMLENIRRIAYKYASLGDKRETTYLFPMTLVISKVFEDRSWDPVSGDDSLKKDKIASNAAPYFLELGLKNGRAIHVFVRSLDTNRGRELPNQVSKFIMKRHKESLLAVGNFQDDMKPSDREPMKETDSHLAFNWSLDILVISPKRK